MPKKDINFGIDIHNTVLETERLDTINKMTYELSHRLLEEGKQVPLGSKGILYHIEFGAKFDMPRKARLVANGY